MHVLCATCLPHWFFLVGVGRGLHLLSVVLRAHICKTFVGFQWFISTKYRWLFSLLLEKNLENWNNTNGWCFTLDCFVLIYMKWIKIFLSLSEGNPFWYTLYYKSKVWCIVGHILFVQKEQIIILINKVIK